MFFPLIVILFIYFFASWAPWNRYFFWEICHPLDSDLIGNRKMNECSGIYLVYDYYSAIWIRIDMLQVFTCLCNALSYMICNLFGILSPFSNYFMPNTGKSSSLWQILALETFPLISSPEGPFGAYYKVPHRGGQRIDWNKKWLLKEQTHSRRDSSPESAA